MLFGEAAHLRIDFGDPPLKLGYAPLTVANVPFRWPCIEESDLRGEKVNGRLKLLKPLAWR
jgi:hypothetical protein